MIQDTRCRIQIAEYLVFFLLNFVIAVSQSPECNAGEAWQSLFVDRSDIVCLLEHKSITKSKCFLGLSVSLYYRL